MRQMAERIPIANGKLPLRLLNSLRPLQPVAFNCPVAVNPERDEDTMVVTSAKPLPRAAAPVDSARSLAADVRRAAADQEAQGMVSPEIATALFENGLYSLLVPSEVGGGTQKGAATPREVLDVLEEISAADGSTGWALMASMAGMGAIYSGLPAAGVARLLESGNPITAGESAPTGTARSVPGGYVVSGRFRYASGSNAAGWFNGSYVLVDDEGRPVQDERGARTIVSGLVPRADVELLGNWDVLGLVATASVDYQITEKLIPDELVRQTEFQRGDELHRASVRSLTCLAHTGVALGLMRGALDEFASFARSKSRPPGGLLARQDAVQRDFAQWRAQYRAARGFALDAFEELRQVIASGQKATPELEADCRLAASHAVYTATEITRDIYLASGGDGLRNGPDNWLQRFFRDAHGASQHMLTAAHVYIEAGRILLDPPGLPAAHKRIFAQVFAPPIVYEDA